MKITSVLQSWIPSIVSVVLSGFVLTLAGCGDGHHHEHEDHGAHVHHAPHGGALSMLGDHAYQLELVPNADSGTLSLYILDGEAERFVRIAVPALRAKANADGREWELSFEAVANQATGERVGDSSQFDTRAPELARLPTFEVRFELLEIQGQVFENVSIPYPEGKH